MKSNKLNYNGFNSHSITGGPNGYPVPGLGIAITYNKDTKHQLCIMPSGEFARKMAEERYGRIYEIIEDKEAQEFFVHISECLGDKILGYFDTKEEAEEAVKEDAEGFLNGLDDYIVASYNCPLAAAADIPSHIDSIAKLTNEKLSDDATESEIAFYLYQLLEELEEVKAEQE